MKNLYFVGAGGIGMAALERYFMAKGYAVAGYDRTPSELTDKLAAEGARISFVDDVEQAIPAEFRDPKETLVVYTPAIPADNHVLSYFRDNGFEVVKRAAVLGRVTHESRGICFAGTHGKTTTSSLAAHILHNCKVDCNAFLGGVLRNYDSNFLLAPESPWSVIEADEFDRSFHHLRPWIAVVTSTDPDHLDIYGTEEAYLESFAHFTSLVQPGGALVVHEGLKLKPRPQEGVKLYSYSRDSGDFHAERIRRGNGEIRFDFVYPGGRIDDISLGVPVEVNIENAVASLAACWLTGDMEPEAARTAVGTFLGAKRRFEFWLKEPGEHGRAIIDDYAHHPRELEATLTTAMGMGFNRVWAVFQPFTYSRTAMLFDDFCRVLSIPDKTVLTEIMGSRERNTYNIYSSQLAEKIPGCVWFSTFEEVADYVVKKVEKGDLVITLGCGDVYKAAKLMIKKLEKQG